MYATEFLICIYMYKYIYICTDRVLGSSACALINKKAIGVLPRADSYVYRREGLARKV